MAAVLLGFCFGECIKQNHKVELRVGRHKHTHNRKCVCWGGCCCWCCKKLCRARQCKKRNTSLSAGLWHCSRCFISPLQLCFIQLFGTISQLATTHTLQTERRYCFRPCDMFTQTPPASSPMNLCGGSGILELLSNFTFKSSVASIRVCLPRACTSTNILLLSMATVLEFLLLHNKLRSKIKC